MKSAAMDGRFVIFAIWDDCKSTVLQSGMIRGARGSMQNLRFNTIRDDRNSR